MAIESQQIEEVKKWYTEIETVFNQHLIGHGQNLKLILTSLLARGHVLLEGYPGSGKTFMIKILTELLALKFQRIQFTPDLLPSDILGYSIFRKEQNKLDFIHGPVFSQMILADEINRTPPKTQAALLEAMEEYQVTIEGTRYKLEEPFFVLATQNPIEMAGTYPLPEAQLDRFMLMLRIQFPPAEEEIDILKNSTEGKDGKNLDFSKIKKVTDSKGIIKLQKYLEHIEINDSILQYIIELTQKTRQHPQLEYGISPRAATHIVHLSRAWALLEGRDYVVPADVQQLWLPVGRHRVILAAEAEMESVTTDRLLAEILQSIEAPR